MSGSDESSALLPVNRIFIEEGKDYVLEPGDELPYRHLRTLWRGPRSVVNEVEDIHTGAIYARKTARYLAFGITFMLLRRRMINNEIKIIRNLGSHHHFIRIFATYVAKGVLGLILQPVADGRDLYAFLEQFRKDAEESEATDSRKVVHQTKTAILQRAFGCLASGLEFMHRLKVIHNTIKPENILIHEGLVIYNDFANSSHSSQSNYGTAARQFYFPDRRYFAPEVLERKSLNSRSDVFSLGCVFIEILSVLGMDLEIDKNFYFGVDIDQVHRQLEKGKSKTSPGFLADISKICISMTHQEPLSRSTASQVLTGIQRSPGYFCSRCQPVGLKESENPLQVRELQGQREGHEFDGQTLGTELLGQLKTEDNANVILPEMANQERNQTVSSISSDNRMKDSERDSRYASAPHTATLSVSSVSAPRDNIELLTVGKIGETKRLYDDDISSQASDEMTNKGMIGKALIIVYLAEEPQFRALWEKAMAKMDRQRFVENVRRLLKSFHRNLSVELAAEAEKATARGRLRISRQLAVHIQQEHEEIWEVDRAGLPIPRKKKHLVERWLANALEAPVDRQGDPEDPEAEFHDQDIDNESSTSGSNNGSERDEFPYISELKTFLQGAKSFQILLKDFMLLFLPTELRHVLLSIRREHVWVSQEQDLSVPNRVKVWVEDNTRVRWNWWPLEPPKRMLQNGESRIFWQCTCGAQQWEEISAPQHELVTKILALSDDKPQMPHWCRAKRTRAPLTTWFTGVFRKVPPAPPTASASSGSSAAQKYTPSGNAASAWSPQHGSSSTSGSSSSATPHQQGSSTTGQQAQKAAPNPAGQTQSWVLLGVQGAQRALIPAQIPINDQSTDYSVFQELKKCYRTRRGRLRLWFSIWRLECCEVAKFNRLTLERMVREHRDLPIDQDYQYSPRAGAIDARNPPISPHLFDALFYTCGFPCTWPIPHDCMPVPSTGVTILERIPKRMRSFERDQTSPIWGFEAVFTVSFAYVLTYHLVIVAGPFAFFLWWPTAHPDDLQNGSIPVTIVLGALSLFWSGAGILTSRRRD